LTHLQKSWKKSDWIRHSEITGLVLGQWIADPERSAADLAKVVGFAKAHGVEGIDGLLFSAATAAVTRNQKAFDNASAELSGLAPRARGADPSPGIAVVDLSGEKPSGPVLVLPDNAGPLLTKALPDLKTHVGSSDARFKQWLIEKCSSAFGGLRSDALYRLYGLPRGRHPHSVAGLLVGSMRAGIASRLRESMRQRRLYLGLVVGGVWRPPNVVSPRFNLGARAAGGKTYAPGPTPQYQQTEPGRNEYGGSTIHEMYRDSRGGRTLTVWTDTKTDANGTVREQRQFTEDSSAEHERAAYTETTRDENGNKTSGTHSYGYLTVEGEGTHSGDSGAEPKPEEEEIYPVPDDPFAGGAKFPTWSPWFDGFVLAVGGTRDPWINPGPDHVGGIGVIVFRALGRGDVDPEGPDERVGPDEVHPKSIGWYFSGGPEPE
jgi:hypothetical protein